MHNNWRPDSLLLSPVDTFADARIRTTAICGGRGTPAIVNVVDREDGTSGRRTRRQWTDASLNWYEVIRAPEVTLAPNESGSIIALGECVEVFAGCTTADAYELKPLIVDNRNGTGLKLVTTGLIDRYLLKWGEMRARYLGDDYEYPRWPAKSAVPGIRRATQRQACQKILVGGLTAVIEAWFDRIGDTAGVVQTWVIRPKTTVEPVAGWWYEILGIINSATFSRVFVNRYGAAAMSGKQITVKKSSLLEMPVPGLMRHRRPDVGKSSLRLPPLEEWAMGTSASATVQALSTITGTLLDLRSGGHQVALLEKIAHHLAGALYGLTHEEREADYQWWCSRNASPACEIDLRVVSHFDSVAALLRWIGSTQKQGAM